MSDELPPKLTHRLKADETMSPLGYHMRIGFHPEIRLDRKKGPEFSKLLGKIFDPSESKLGSESWEFIEPKGSSPNCFLSVVVEPSNFQFHVSYPEHGKEWYETRFKMLMTSFREFFSPDLVMESSAMIHGLLPVDGDARTFLAGHVTRMGGAKITPFGRPMQLFGLRFFFPPFGRKVKGKGKKMKDDLTEWQVDVKIESCLEDPSKVYLQAEAMWPKPTKWDNAAEESILQQLATVSDYIEKNVIEFLLLRPGDKPGEKLEGKS